MERTKVKSRSREFPGKQHLQPVAIGPLLKKKKTPEFHTI
jgi:hypothetical protein